MSEQSKQLARRAIEEVWNGEDLGVAKQIYAGDYVAHTEVGEIKGAEAFLQYLSSFRDGFPDLEFEVEDVIGEGDKVVVRWSGRGTHEGEFQGISPTGKECTADGMTLFRIAANRIIEDRGNWDRLGLMQQLGVIPTPEKA